MTPDLLWLGGVFLLSAGIVATIYVIKESTMKIKPVDLWPLLLLAMLIVALIGVAITGDARWLFLAVLPCIVFAKWLRI
jgi:hypothetical protein